MKKEKIYDYTVSSWREWLKLKEKGYTGVAGDFLCTSSKIASLKLGPEYVGGTFDVSSNELTSLEFFPKCIGGSLDFSRNKIESLEHCPKEIGGFLDCSYNRLTSVDLKFFPKMNESIFYCSNNSKNLEEYNKKEGCFVFDLLLRDKEELELSSLLKEQSKVLPSLKL